MRSQNQSPAPEADIRVLLVEDDPATSARLQSAPRQLARHPGSGGLRAARQRLRMAGHAGARRAALRSRAAGRLRHRCHPPRARRLHPRCDCMVITMFGDEANVLASIAAGATGYLLKDESDDNLRAFVLELRAGGSPMSPVIARKVITSAAQRQRAGPAGAGRARRPRGGGDAFGSRNRGARPDFSRLHLCGNRRAPVDQRAYGAGAYQEHLRQACCQLPH
ncbi:hypothetical protein ACU4GD_26795 [Cupriavidus basilensis]